MGNETKKKEMGGTCSTYEEKKGVYGDFGGET
jgi:hypothetical protein